MKRKKKTREEGTCKFNCRTNREAFLAGYDYRRFVEMGAYEDNPYKLYRQWKK